MRTPARHASSGRVDENNATVRISNDNAISKSLEGLKKAVLTATALFFLKVLLRRHFHHQTQLVVAEGFQQITLRVRLTSPLDRFEVGPGCHIQNSHR